MGTSLALYERSTQSSPLGRAKVCHHTNGAMASGHSGSICPGNGAEGGALPSLGFRGAIRARISARHAALSASVTGTGLIFTGGPDVRTPAGEYRSTW